jgi:predicted RND superfamily exporter protein
MLEDLPDELAGRYRAAAAPYAGQVLIEVIPTEDLRDPAARAHFVDAVQAVAPRASGVAVTIVEAGRAVVAAFAQALLLALVAITLLLLAVLRSALDTVLVLAPLLLAALLTVAVGVAFGLPFNFANVIVLPLLLGLGVDSGIHYVIRAREEAGGRLAGAANSTPRAILLSALTTVASFGALSLSQHPGTASMGLLLTIALLLTLLCVLALLPALLALAGRLPRD